MEKQYDHKKQESGLYDKWEKARVFEPSGKGKPFTIIMPPPNANDPLHIGHARFVTISDILVRYHRMKGESTLWLPGADHAGIETQFVFEKKLSKKGKSRFDYDRDTLYKMIWDYVDEQSGTMEKQMRVLGASCDWTKFKFTLDPDIVDIVLKNFKRLYDEGLVYRGERLVNYSPANSTFFSELEIEHVEQKGRLYTLDYGTIQIATTRPETIFADVAVAVNPKDKRYKKLIGKTAIVPITGKEVPIIADELVDKDFGTGALKITPGHDHTDYEIGQKHELPTVTILGLDGKLANTADHYDGLKPHVAREKIINELESKGLIKSTKEIIHSVAVDYKHKKPIEPLMSEQWFVKTGKLSKLALDSIKKGEVKFAAKKYEKIAAHWFENLKDWNISRQIVWGIRIPAFSCQDCGEWTVTSGEEPKKCGKCGNTTLVQDPDTFDTWFSSGQWPFATLQATGDFDTHYPTSVMVTAYDILFMWVSRMIMFGKYFTGAAPFKDVLLYGLVRDKEGLKISKSKGNVIDPIDMTEKYGADALRMGLVWGATIDNDIALSEDNIRGQRNFSNKLWNVARFVTMEKANKEFSKPSHVDDKKIIEELSEATKRISEYLESYRLNEAAEVLYDFIWNKFANTYLETTKDRREEAQPVLEHVLEKSLILAHPFMPFVTEAIWAETFARGKEDLLASASWLK